MSIAAIVTGGFGSFGRAESIPKAGFSSYVDLPEPPDTGKQYIIVQEPSGSWDEESIPYGASPAVVDDDILVVDLLTEDGYPIVVGSDGIAIIDTDGDASRQEFDAAHYDVSTLTLSAAVTNYVRNNAPVFTGAGISVSLRVGLAMTPINFIAMASDVEGDTLTALTHTGVLPTGTSITDGVWSGTPTDEETGQFVLPVEDIAGDTDSLIVDWITVDVAIVPNLIGVTNLATATGQVLAANLVVAEPVLTAPSTAPIGSVIDQDPVADEEVEPGSEVILTLSAGVIGTLTQTLIDEFGDPVPNLDDVTVLIWRGDLATGTPDVELYAQTTDGDGVGVWEFAAADLTDGDAVFFVAYRGDPPSAFTAGRVVATYEDGES